jgi:hypothetical protein
VPDEEFPHEKLPASSVCDICSSSCFQPLDPDDPIFGNDEHAELTARWGYSTEKDLENHSCRMCESCYDKVAAFITETLGGTIHVKSCIDGETWQMKRVQSSR